MINRFIEIDRNTFHKYCAEGLLRFQGFIGGLAEDRLILQSSNFRGVADVKLWVYFILEGSSSTTVSEVALSVDNWKLLLDRHSNHIDKNKFRFRSKHV